jgi:Ni,Fe-hydrogenase III large subunit/Ni,Fe-hydrogenase III component G
MDYKKKYISHLQATWGLIVVPEKSFVKNELYLQIHPNGIARLPEICADIVTTFNAHFVTLIATDERSEKKKYFVSYVFSIPRDDLFLILRVQVDPGQHEVPSVSSHLEAANWFEREMKDWFGIIPFPNIQKLGVHPDWPEDLYPMLKDFERQRPVPRVRGSFDFKHVEGEGVFEIPVGPVHAGIIEPGHFRFSVAGEPIINLDVQLYYTHKGTEKIAEGMTPQRVVFLAERISGDSSFAHALAFCHALERACDLEIPKRALIVRTILLELERLYNHIGDIGAILLDVGFAAGAATAFTLKERFMHFNEILTGSRLLRGIATIGGVRRDIENTTLKREALKRITKEGRAAFEHLVALALSSSTVRDRLETTGLLTQEDALRLGIVGIAARASGVSRDLRRDHPHCAYQHLDFHTTLQTTGDVFARMNVRIEEVREAFHILDQICHQPQEDQILAAMHHRASDRYALGYVEGWRGEIVHWIMTDKTGNISRWKITDPSSHNWRALKVSVLDNIVPDFPVINKSFNLSYSGNDR